MTRTVHRTSQLDLCEHVGRICIIFIYFWHVSTTNTHTSHGPEVQHEFPWWVLHLAIGWSIIPWSFDLQEMVFLAMFLGDALGCNSHWIVALVWRWWFRGTEILGRASNRIFPCRDLHLIGSHSAPLCYTFSTWKMTENTSLAISQGKWNSEFHALCAEQTQQSVRIPVMDLFFPHKLKKLGAFNAFGIGKGVGCCLCKLCELYASLCVYLSQNWSTYLRCFMMVVSPFGSDIQHVKHEHCTHS